MKTNWLRLLVAFLIGLVAGALSSFYVYGTVFSWIVPVFVLAFVGAESLRLALTTRGDRGRAL